MVSGQLHVRPSLPPASIELEVEWDTEPVRTRWRRKCFPSPRWGNNLCRSARSLSYYWLGHPDYYYYCYYQVQWQIIFLNLELHAWTRQPTAVPPLNLSRPRVFTLYGVMRDGRTRQHTVRSTETSANQLSRRIYSALHTRKLYLL
jgi:hypothetical protein